jgi:hypothetical protein
MVNLSAKVILIIENSKLIAKRNGCNYVDVQDLITAIFNDMDAIEIISRLRSTGIDIITYQGK